MSTELENGPKYIEFIESCYRSNQASLPYYNRLISYLSRESGSSQPYSLFEVSATTTTSTYPSSSLFHPIPVGEDPNQNLPRVLILEGFPSPAQVASVGARWRIRPEFFIGHLPPRPSHDSRVYELPNLPSLQDNLISIRYASLVKNIIKRRDSASIARRRSELEKACSNNEKALIDDKRYGASRFRKINLHNGEFCSVEQTVTLTVVGDTNQWTAIFLTDQGSMPIDCSGMPWSQSGPNGRPMGTLALVPYNFPASGATDWLTQLDEFHPLKNVLANDTVDQRLLIEDPFFLLSASLKTSLMSWTQLLNFIAENIEESNNHLELDQRPLRNHLDQLRFQIGLLHRIKDYLSDCLESIKYGGSQSWPKARDNEVIQRKQLLQDRLQGDYNHVIARCSLMIDKCQSAIDVLVGVAQLAAAQRGISQAKEVQSLTKMAAIFIPVSFATSLFGMNIAEWQPAVSIRWFITVAVLFSCLSFALVYHQACIKVYWRVREKIDGHRRSFGGGLG